MQTEVTEPEWRWMAWLQRSVMTEAYDIPHFFRCRDQDTNLTLVRQLTATRKSGCGLLCIDRLSIFRVGPVSLTGNLAKNEGENAPLSHVPSYQMHCRHSAAVRRGSQDHRIAGFVCWWSFSASSRNATNNIWCTTHPAPGVRRTAVLV